MSKFTLFILALALVFGVNHPSFSAQPPKAKAPSKRAQTDTEGVDGERGKSQKSSTSAGAGADEVLSDSWFTVTVNKVTHYGYYNERFELTKGRLRFQQHFMKLEEGYMNEEQLGAFAENNDDLTPLFFNFHSTYRTTETLIDGSIQDGKALMVKIKKGNQELPLVKRSIPQKTFLSVFFPVWLAKNAHKLKSNQTISFKTILEDNLELGFAPVTGRIKLEKPDEFANKTQTKKILVDYRNMRSYWWVDQTGSYIRIEMPSQNTVVERVTKEKATQFLER